MSTKNQNATFPTTQISQRRIRSHLHSTSGKVIQQQRNAAQKQTQTVTN